jgi:hypothetical protein
MRCLNEHLARRAKLGKRLADLPFETFLGNLVPGTTGDCAARKTMFPSLTARE